MNGILGRPAHLKFKIMVVDDDSTSLSITSAILRQWRYDVLTVKRPVEAAGLVRFDGEIDLVISDLHMPVKNGIELQKEINEEFPQLPVMIVSSDSRECMIMKALASGVVHYIVKPLKKIDLKNVWQHAYAYRRTRYIFLEEARSFELDDNGVISSSSSANEAGTRKKKRESSKALAAPENKRSKPTTSTAAPRKPKITWTDSLHNCFLEAIRYISLEKAVPKKILQVMNVAGLTRENVASHLQKYRIFLRKVAERAAAGAAVGSKNNPMRSSFASGHAAMVMRDAREYAHIIEKQQQMRGESQFLPRYGASGNIGPSRRSFDRSVVGFPTGNQSMFNQSFPGKWTYPLYSGTAMGGSSGALLSNNSPFSYNGGINNNGYGMTNAAAVAPGLVLAPGESSSSSGSFAGFGGYQSSRAFPVVNSSPMLTPQQQYIAPNRFGGFGLMGNKANANASRNVPTSQQCHQGIAFGDLPIDPYQYPFLLQQQGGHWGCAMNNPNFAIGFHSGTGTFGSAGLNVPISQTQNPDLTPRAYNGVGGNATSPWIEPTLAQLEEIEELLNSESAANMADLFNNDYFPGFEPNPNQQQQGGGQTGFINHSELNRPTDQPPNSPSENQGWDDEFINSLFRDNPY